MKDTKLRSPTPRSPESEYVPLSQRRPEHDDLTVALSPRTSSVTLFSGPIDERVDNDGQTIYVVMGGGPPSYHNEETDARDVLGDDSQLYRLQIERLEQTDGSEIPEMLMVGGIRVEADGQPQTIRMVHDSNNEMDHARATTPTLRDGETRELQPGQSLYEIVVKQLQV